MLRRASSDRAVHADRHRSPCSRGLLRAFTLVELAVTVALLALLVAMLLPMLSRAREGGRRANCLANMRQIGNSMLLFASEHQGELPPYLYQADPVGGGQYQMTFKSAWTIEDIGPGGHQATLLCPSDKSPAQITTTDANGNPITIRSSYSYNFTLFMTDTRSMRVPPARTALLFDGDPDAASASLWYGAPTAEQGADGNYVVCHVPPGNPNAATTQYHSDWNFINGHLNPTGGGHAGCYLGPCGGPGAWNLIGFNTFNSGGLENLARRHSRRANIIFLDGHADWLANLPTGSVPLP